MIAAEKARAKVNSSPHFSGIVMKRNVIIGAVLLASAAMYFPAAAQAQVGVNIIIGTAPPPARYEVVPRPRHGYLWAPGYWDWNGRQYIWIQGHWERAYPGRIYQRPEWHHERNGWHLDRGGWHEQRHYDRHGRHDGGPDRYDHRHDDYRGRDRH